MSTGEIYEALSACLPLYDLLRKVIQMFYIFVFLDQTGHSRTQP